MPEQEIIHLPSAGSIPGIPGQHGPGAYVVNWAERTIKRLVDHLAEFNQLKEAPATGAPIGEGISLASDGVEREVTLEAAPGPPVEAAPAPEPESAPPEEAPAEPTSEEAQPAAPQEANEEVQPAADDAAQE